MNKLIVILSSSLFISVNFEVNGELLIAIPNSSNPKDQLFQSNHQSNIFNGLRPAVYNNQQFGQNVGGNYGYNYNGQNIQTGQQTGDPNGALTITIKLQPHQLSAIMGGNGNGQFHTQNGNQQNSASIIRSQTVIPAHNIDINQDIYYRNHNQQLSDSLKNSALLQNGQSNFKPQHQTQSRPYSTLGSRYIPPPMKTIEEKPGKETETTENNFSAIDTITKTVFSIPSNLDLLFNDMGKFYRKKLFNLRDSLPPMPEVKLPLPEIPNLSMPSIFKSRNKSNKKKYYPGEQFLDGYGV